MYIPRAIEAQLAYLAEHFPAVLVTGARQTGNTTLLRRHIEARQAPELFLQHFPAG